MKRVGNLWEELTGWENMVRSLKLAAAGKRFRPDVAAFLCDAETQLARLRLELIAGEYLPGPYHVFRIHEPKPRQISAAPFRDRVVHHALTGVLEPVFERRFHPASFACRKGLGTHAALRHVRSAAARYRYALKLDIRKYFPSIDHEVLVAQLERVVKCRPSMELAKTIIHSSNPQETVNWYFPGDHLFTPHERRRGLPLGNQTSQFFANVYLNPLDHFVARELRPSCQARYVDDLLLLDDDKHKLHAARERIENFLIPFRLTPHPGKTAVQRVADGVTFLGWRVFPDRTRLVRSNVVRARRRLQYLAAMRRARAVEWETVRQSVLAWIGHATHGDTWELRSNVFRAIAF